MSEAVETPLPEDKRYIKVLTDGDDHIVISSLDSQEYLTAMAGWKTYSKIYRLVSPEEYSELLVQGLRGITTSNVDEVREAKIEALLAATRRVVRHFDGEVGDFTTKLNELRATLEGM